MVKTAGGGVGGSQLQIVGSMDTSDIDRGFSRIESGFEGSQTQAKTFQSTLSGMARTAGGLASSLAKLGTVGVGAMVGLATQAPAVAPALADMQVRFHELTRTLGRALAPAFETASDWFGSFVDFVSDNEETIRDVSVEVMNFAENIGGVLKPALEGIANFAGEHPRLFAGILGGLMVGPMVIRTITSLAGLAKTLGSITIGATTLTALGYLSAIAGGSVAVAYGLQMGVDRLQNFLGMDKTGDGTGQTMFRRAGMYLKSLFDDRPPEYEEERWRHEARTGELDAPTGGKGVMLPSTDKHKEAMEKRDDRSFWLLSLWDRAWS